MGLAVAPLYRADGSYPTAVVEGAPVATPFESVREDVEVEQREPVALRCSAVVFRKDSVLLCRRVGEVDRWVLPGGTPRPAEGSAACARREVLEETGIAVDTSRVAFVLEASNHDVGDHLIEIVFVGIDRHPQSAPERREPGLIPEFVPLDGIAELRLFPPIGGYLRGLHRSITPFGADRATGAYLGNVWRPAE
jgi:8-oxo-dGTP diphosphatase